MVVEARPLSHRVFRVRVFNLRPSKEEDHPSSPTISFFPPRILIPPPYPSSSPPLLVFGRLGGGGSIGCGDSTASGVTGSPHPNLVRERHHGGNRSREHANEDAAKSLSSLTLSQQPLCGKEKEKHRNDLNKPDAILED